MPGKSIFVANWKMNMRLADAVKFAHDNKEGLEKLSANPNAEIVICPSLHTLDRLIQFFKKTEVHIGAQNCSEHEKGAYTGEVSAMSLSDVGIDYCIVGHSERRTYFGETNEMVAQKAAQLFKYGIQPIICIGETKEEYENKKTFEVLEEQLGLVLQVINDQGFCIAYEPVWSIGTGIVPEKKYIEDVFAWIYQRISQELPEAQFRLIYGGSVDENNAPEIKQVPHVDGFLIGGASLDFQKLKKIVLLSVGENI